MSYNPNCYAQYCSQGCCKYNGYCPIFSASECFYYYYEPIENWESLSKGGKIGLIVGLSILGVILIIGIICCIIKCKNRDNINMQIARPNNEVVIIDNPPYPHNTPYGNYQPNQPHSSEELNMNFNGYHQGYQQNHPHQNYYNGPPNNSYNHQNYQQNGPVGARI